MTANGDDHHRQSIAAAVVLPTFNHGATLAGVLDGLAVLDLPIIVVDDGSTDGTRERFEEWVAAHPLVRVITRRHNHNRGKAEALKTGFSAAREAGATHAATIDADGQLEPSDIPALLNAATADPRALVLGIRPEQIERRPERARVGRDFANLAIRAECGLRVKDSQCGLRLYPLELVEQIRCAAARYSYEAEVIARAVWAGYNVIEVPVQCRYFEPGKRVSHFRVWRDTIRQIGVHLRLLGRSLVPWPHRKLVAQTAAKPGPRPVWRRALDWVNPLRAWRDVRASELGNLELASAMGIGAWIGATPFYGFHSAISVFVAWRLHMHPAAMVLGSQISAPPIGIALAIVSVSVGHVIMARSLPSWREFRDQSGDLATLAERWLPMWTVGSLVVGLALGVCVFALMMTLGRAVRARHRATGAASGVEGPGLAKTSSQ